MCGTTSCSPFSWSHLKPKENPVKLVQLRRLPEHANAIELVAKANWSVQLWQSVLLERTLLLYPSYSLLSKFRLETVALYLSNTYYISWIERKMERVSFAILWLLYISFGNPNLWLLKVLLNLNYAVQFYWNISVVIYISTFRIDLCIISFNFFFRCSKLGCCCPNEMQTSLQQVSLFSHVILCSTNHVLANSKWQDYRLGHSFRVFIINEIFPWDNSKKSYPGCTHKK